MTTGDPCSKCREEDVEALADTAVNQRLHGWERAQAVNALVAEVARLSGERERLREALRNVRKYSYDGAPLDRIYRIIDRALSAGTEHTRCGDEQKGKP